MPPDSGVQGGRRYIAPAGDAVEARIAEYDGLGGMTDLGEIVAIRRDRLSRPSAPEMLRPAVAAHSVHIVHVYWDISRETCGQRGKGGGARRS